MAKNIEKIIGNVNLDKEYIKEVALIKMFLELVTMDPDFKARLEADPEKVLAEYNVPYAYEDLRILYDAEVYKEYEKTKEIPLFIRRYQGFIKEKLEMRKEMQVDKCKPDNKTMSIWRQRQINRCWFDLGGHNDSIVHTPVIFELDLGCSVGCPFCGVDAPRLSKIAKYEENKELWRSILDIMEDIIGPAAGSGTCYYATEPLDNPDYELFVDDFYKKFGHLPQITTAVPLRKVERTRKAFQHMNETSPTIYRCSLRSLDQLKEMHKEFKPEEILLVELLPQFDDAPQNKFSSVGRAAKDLGEVSNGMTIACITGFIINIAEKSVRLETPCGASQAHPTGENIIAKEYFTDSESFRDIIEKMIKEYMKKEIQSEQKIAFYPYIQAEEDAIGITLKGHTGFKLHFKNEDESELHKELIKHIKKGDKTKMEIAGDMYDAGYQPANVFVALNNLFKAGALVE